MADPKKKKAKKKIGRVDANGVVHIKATFNNTQVTISDMTAQYGDVGCCVYFGGGISNAGILTLTNSTVSGNASSGGGGI